MSMKPLTPKMEQALMDLLLSKTSGVTFETLNPAVRRGLVSRELAVSYQHTMRNEETVTVWHMNIEGELLAEELLQRRDCYTLEQAWEETSQCESCDNLLSRFDLVLSEDVWVCMDCKKRAEMEQAESDFEEARGDFGQEGHLDLVVIGQSDLDDATKWIQTKCALCHGTSDLDNNPLMPYGMTELAHQGCLDQLEREAALVEHGDGPGFDPNWQEQFDGGSGTPEMEIEEQEEPEDIPLLTNEQVLQTAGATRMELEVIKMAKGDESRYLAVIVHLSRYLPRWIVERLIDRLVLERCHACKAKPVSRKWRKLVLAGDYLMPTWAGFCSKSCAA